MGENMNIIRMLGIFLGLLITTGQDGALAQQGGIRGNLNGNVGSTLGGGLNGNAGASGAQGCSSYDPVRQQRLGLQCEQGRYTAGRVRDERTDAPGKRAVK
jgi:hypothetical protein